MDNVLDFAVFQKMALFLSPGDKSIIPDWLYQCAQQSIVFHLFPPVEPVSKM
jgi:hypothetical protein